MANRYVNAERSTPLGEHEKQCPVCEKLFVTDDIRIIYCSEKCKIRHNARTRKPRLRPESHHVEDGQYQYTCPVCSEMFRSNSNNAKYCHETCRKSAANHRYYKSKNKSATRRRRDKKDFGIKPFDKKD